MCRLIIAFFLSALGVSSTANCEIVIPERFAQIERIADSGVALCDCPCVFFVEIVDTLGQSLVLCQGKDPNRPHPGFRTGQSYRDHDSLEIIALGSATESLLLARIYEYLDRSFSFELLQKMQHPDSLSALDIDSGVRILLNMLRQRERGIAIRRWLATNFSEQQLRTLIATPYAELKTSREKEAFQLFCESQDGTFWWRASDAGCSRR